MFPGGVNPKQMGQMMKRFGIKNEEINAKEVLITLNNGKKLRIENPQVQSIEMQGNKTYTIAGKVIEESGVPEEDIQLVAEQANVSKEEAKSALEENNGDIAAAILSLKK
ncbi:MAG: nascent polypeptide-associated complex protein [Candidatus Diapherotrites archaeon]|nr:nascent polypeptide-associated complex protein [Candidatus Diapherotrites archaeon]